MVVTEEEEEVVVEEEEGEGDEGLLHGQVHCTLMHNFQYIDF